MQENKNTKSKKAKKKEEYKVIRSFSKDGDSFQKVMERILMNKLNNI